MFYILTFDIWCNLEVETMVTSTYDDDKNDSKKATSGN